MNFGKALELIKKGYKLTRHGWNGKGQYLFLAYGIDLTSCLFKDKSIICNDSICLKTVQDTITIGWIPSQTDMLAEDWKVVE